jgi:hypothetical protein
VGCPALQEVAIAVLRQPLGARQVALPDASRALGFLRRIDVQDDTRDFGPIRTLGIGVEEAEVGNKMLLVVTGKDLSLGGLVGNWGIERRLGHDHDHQCRAERDTSRQGAFVRAVIAAP